LTKSHVELESYKQYCFSYCGACPGVVVEFK